MSGYHVAGRWPPHPAPSPPPWGREDFLLLPLMREKAGMRVSVTYPFVIQVTL